MLNKKESISVKIDRVTNPFKISAIESLKEKIYNILERSWDGNDITGFHVKKEHNCFSVETSCWQFTEDFTVSSAASLLESLAALA